MVLPAPETRSSHADTCLAAPAGRGDFVRSGQDHHPSAVGRGPVPLLGWSALRTLEHRLGYHPHRLDVRPLEHHRADMAIARGLFPGGKAVADHFGGPDEADLVHEL